VRATSWTATVFVLLGCAAGDSGSSAGGRGSNPTTAIMPGIMQPAAGAGAPSTTGDGFGNAAMPVAPRTEQMRPGCEAGKFCGPMAADEGCGSLTLEAEVEVIEKPGNVLLVFDTSGSMGDAWNGRPRWQNAGDAVRNALMPLAARLTVGTVFFPRNDPNSCVDPTGIACVFVPGLGCGVTPITSADQINFMPGPMFLTAFAGGGTGLPAPYAPVLAGLTPLKEGLDQARNALAGATLSGITSVVVITDGDPNCAWDAAGARQIVTDWHAKGINTHVIGLPGTTGAGDAVLRELAVAGGTGEYITPDDSKALEQKLGQIATETVQAGFDTCQIAISPPAAVPDKLHLIVTDNGMPQSVARDLAADYSWSVSAGGDMVTLEGRLCDDALGGRFEALRFEFGCVDVPPLAPPPPVM
jgi:hypothetical protein